MKACCIVGAGDFSNFDFIKKENDLIIAADGGYKHLRNIGVQPDIAVGDFDSLGFTPNDVDTIVLPVKKDITDMKAAIDIGIEKGYESFYIYGGCGGRTDHTLSNIQLAASVAEMGFKIFIVDGKTIITAIHNSKFALDSTHKGYISVFSHSDISKGVTLKGLKYTLENADITNSFPLGVSNEFIGIESEISVENGTLIIVYNH